MKENLTPIQSRMWSLLSDGGFHTMEELRRCLNDELSTSANVKPHVSLLRKKLPIGLMIVSHRNGGGKVGYQLVRRLSSPNTGRT